MRADKDRDVTIHSSDFLACCDTGGRGLDVVCAALSATTPVDASPTRLSTPIGNGVDGGRSSGEAQSFMRDGSLVDGTDIGETGTAPSAASTVDVPAPEQLSMYQHPPQPDSAVSATYCLY